MHFSGGSSKRSFVNNLGLHLLLVLGFWGCGHSSDEAPAETYSPSDTSRAITALYQSDVAALTQISSDSIADFDSDVSQRDSFRKIFGGETGEDVLNYYRQRVHYVYTQEQINHAFVSPGSFPNDGWATVKNNPKGSSPDAITADTSSTARIKIGAINISTVLWLKGEVNRTPVTLFVGDDTIALDSTRVGVIMLAEGYTSTVTGSDGEEHNIPALRQAILVHEARHSDCTGGLSESTLSIMRSVDSAQELNSKLPRQYCGHTHIVCETGLYEGLSACDSEQFGAYTVGAIYEAALVDAQKSEVEKSILRMSAFDYLTRYVDSGPTNSYEENPDMSSVGVGRL